MATWLVRRGSGDAMTEPKRVCRRCARPLSRYNPGEVCGPCAVDAQPIPAEVWTIPDVREALASWDLATVCTLIREHAGMSQERLAELIGRSQGYVSQLESGARLASGVMLVRDLVDGLGIPTELLGGAESS
ncbi:helix-turn-helix transcriptional regulator [Sphaerisporangium sp. NPDC051017]|uniref:helix-turn-helix domain-containing protein n=1 Tax=Sphaerisporangium sp. NPDC051017 TaxID=3154636 RepID=UPI003442F4FB